ncbi:TonB-dependent receptor [Porphyrobacter algicida]|uniref:TonB-dependent receptor n=1 Tax=Qipengyuania algicida TaxID=1836209 RepID=A0A845AK88_9SPHN|nr:TonB-dependent receptor [Qipengyuania algicida]MXP30034.1 TonB-dependent receptor [Qipengyuania algicida]
MTSCTKLLRVALVSSCALAPVAAMAQDATQIAPIDVDNSAGGDNASMPIEAGTKITRKGLARDQQSTSDTAQILTTLPGVSANTGGGISSMPVIRGLSEQRLGITVDGFAIDAACPNDMNSPLSYTDPQTIASITVLTGVAPVSNGGDSIGGIIAVESAPPRFATGKRMLVTGKASSFYRSNGDGFGGSASVTVAGQHLSATYTGSYTQSDQYDGGGDLGEVRSTEYAKTDQSLALAWQGGASLVQLKGGFQYAPYEGFPNQWMDMTDNKSWFLNASYDGYFDWGDLVLRASYRDTDHEMNFLEDKLPGSMPMNTEVHSFDASAKASPRLSDRHTLNLGVEYHHQWLNDYWPPVAGNMMMGPDAFVNVNGAHRDRLGVYGEWVAKWSDRFTSTFGIRYDRVSMNTGDVQPYGTGMMQMADVMAAAAFNAADHQRTDNNWSGSELLTYRLSPSASIELGFAHKVRSPNIYERYSWGRGGMASRMIGWFGDGNGYVGNLDLKPERADTVSAALDLGGSAQGYTLRISPYYTRVHDYIDARFIQILPDMMGMPSPFVQLRFANQEAEFYGLDVSGSLRLAKGKDGDGTDLTGSLAWQRGNNLTDGGPVYHQMPFNARLGLSHHAGPLELHTDAQFVADKTRVDATRNEPTTAGYTLVDLGASYKIGPARLSLDVTNLFDEAYSLPLGGLSLGDYKATDVLRPVPGRGRSFNIGLGFEF